jgi:aryl-alcohol dehydrogenase-like predicted oxidoreductase
MAIDPQGHDWNALALRFAAYAPGVASAIVGTHKLENLHRNVEIIAQGQLEPALQQVVLDAFARSGSGWDALI